MILMIDQNEDSVKAFYDIARMQMAMKKEEKKRDSEYLKGMQ